MSRMKSFCENGIIGLYVIVWKKHCDSCCCTETWYCLKLIYTFNNKNNKAAFTALFGSKLLSNRSVRHSADVGACDLCSRHVITGKCVVSYKLCVDISSSVVPSSEERERENYNRPPSPGRTQPLGGGRGEGAPPKLLRRTVQNPLSTSPIILRGAICCPYYYSLPSYWCEGCNRL